MDVPSGVLNVDKPLGVTSHDVVAQVRRALGVRRVGHAGTLDPLATGILLICVGPAVRLSEFLMASTKTYVADLQLGRATTTDDAEGAVTAEVAVDHLTAEDITAILPAYTGEIEQIPPAFSAVKQGGRKLYELARKGHAVQAAPRRVRIDALRLLNWSPPVARVEVVCGPGTYIRSLARDLGHSLGVGGSLSALRRTVSGAFRVEDALPSEALADPSALRAGLVPLRRALAGWPEVALDDAGLDALRHGRRVRSDGVPQAGALALAVNAHGEVVALLRAVDGGWQPDRVLFS